MGKKAGKEYGQMVAKKILKSAALGKTECIPPYKVLSKEAIIKFEKLK